MNGLVGPKTTSIRDKQSQMHLQALSEQSFMQMEVIFENLLTTRSIHTYPHSNSILSTIHVRFTGHILGDNKNNIK